MEPQKSVDGIVKNDTMLVNETECPAIVAGRKSYGKCRVNALRHMATERLREQLVRSKTFFLGVLFVACVISICSIGRTFVEKSEYRYHYKGDIGSELNAYTAGLNFSRHGFAKLYFLPAIARYEDSLDALQKQRLYTHYPPGPDLVSGGLQILGIHGFYQQQGWLLSLNLIAMLLLGFAIRRMLPEEQTVAPFVLVSIAITSVWFVWWSGNLHQSTYGDLITAFAVWAVVGQKDRLYLLACFMALFFSFEPVPWLCVVGMFMAIQKVTAKTWSVRRALVFLAAMAAMFCLSFGIHLFQNACYFHSFSAALEDMRTAYQHRTGVNTSGGESYSVVKHITKAAYALLWFYGTGVLILAGIGLKTSFKRRLWLPVVLLCAGLAWPIALRQHSMVHAFTWRYLGVASFVLATIGFLSWWELATWKKPAALLLLLAALLRIPLGCEISANRLFLGQLQKVVARTDSATIADLIWFLKDNPDHIRGKTILINELAGRGHALPDQPAYTIVRNGKSFTLVREEQGQWTWYRNLPRDRTPAFHDSVFPYLDPAGPRYEVPSELRGVVEPRTPLSTAGTPVELIITGNSNKPRYRLLLACLLLQ